MSHEQDKGARAHCRQFTEWALDLDAHEAPEQEDLQNLDAGLEWLYDHEYLSEQGKTFATEYWRYTYHDGHEFCERCEKCQSCHDCACGPPEQEEETEEPTVDKHKESAASRAAKASKDELKKAVDAYIGNEKGTDRYRALHAVWQRQDIQDQLNRFNQLEEVEFGTLLHIISLFIPEYLREKGHKPCRRCGEYKLDVRKEMLAPHGNEVGYQCLECHNKSWEESR